MKNFKFLFTFGILLYGFKIFAQTDCLPDQQGCTPVAVDLQDIIQLPDYPGCPISVTYDLRVCGGESQIANVSIGLPDDGGACGILTMDA